jgi:phosphate transport system permease protein
MKLAKIVSSAQNRMKRNPPSRDLVKHKRSNRDRASRVSMRILAVCTGVLVPAFVVILFLRARPILETQSLSTLLFSSSWRPTHGEFGFLPFITGTLAVTMVAMIIGVPPSLLTAIYLAEYLHPRIRSLLMPIIDLLAGIPSVIYGIWGVLTIVPFIQHDLMPVVDGWLGFSPLFKSNNPTGYGVLAGGIVLAVMVFPIIIAVAEEVIRTVPLGLREASWALGASKWQTTSRVVLRKAFPGVMAAVLLGFSRAFGETMAVLMVVGNVAQVPRSIFDPAYPLTALIANSYGEMMSIPLYDAALLGAAFILLLVIIIFNLASRVVLARIKYS